MLVRFGHVFQTMQISTVFLVALAALAVPSAGALNATETSLQYILQNDRLSVAVNKTNGQMAKVVLDDQDFLGARGKGPYVDCYCTPDGFWDPGASDLRKYQLIQDVDSTGTAYGGIVMGDTYEKTNQSIEQFWFLRDGETGLHVFTRVYYFNELEPFLGGMDELRTLFRPDTPLWTHFYASENNYAHAPSQDVLESAPYAQDATNYLGNLTEEAYVEEFADFFTKYAFSDQWRNHKVHGMWSDGTTSGDGNTYGAWMVHNTVDTYYGGPLHSDIMVDGILVCLSCYTYPVLPARVINGLLQYNYISSRHHGSPGPNITHGFDRTFGPQYHHFNKGGSIQKLAADAAQFANPLWNAQFYDDIAKHVPNYVTSDKRTTWSAIVEVPSQAKRPIAVLSENGHDFQDNVQRQGSMQYWGEIDKNTGTVEIPRVREGTYRLTVYADDVFGWFIEDDVEVQLSTNTSTPKRYHWQEESAGTEIWRIGTPDKSAGEFKHGNKPFANKTNHPEEFRMYWAMWDFPTDFPDGVDFRIGESNIAEDFNYIHWSVISHVGNWFRDEPYHKNVNNWTIRFDLTDAQLADKNTATLTVDLAGVKTGSNDDRWVNLPYTLNMNDKDVETWVIPWWTSTSCGVRSAVSCRNTGHKFQFPVNLLNEGENVMVLSLPFNASSVEPAQLPWTTYLQYDALRLEIA